MELILSQWFFLWSAVIALFSLKLIKMIAKSSGYGRLPPGPKPLPIVGNMLMIGDKPHRSLAHLAKTYGPLMSIKLGRVTTVVVSSPDMAREVLQKKDQAFYGRSPPDAVRADRHDEYAMSFRPVDQHWKNLRKICSTQLFTSRRMDDKQRVREMKVRELVVYVGERCKAGESVDIGRAAFTTVLNMISSTIFSIDMVDPRSESPQYFRDLMWAFMAEAGAPNVSDFFPMLRVFDLQGRKRRVAAINTKMLAVFDELIDRRMQSKGKSDSPAAETTNDFLDSLIHYHTDDKDVKIDRRTIQALLLELFGAGSDTSSITVEWAMAELLRNPSSMEKARAELMSTIGGIVKEVCESDIQRLPYLQAVVKETLLLHAPTPFLLPRRTEETVELSGYTIPKHTRVLVNAWAIGRDGDVWSDPDSFAPERFTSGGGTDREVGYNGQDFELIPFGAGRRICPGLPLAFRMVHLMLASLLHSFDWKLPDGMEPTDVDMTDKFGITVAKAVPLQAIPVFYEAG